MCCSRPSPGTPRTGPVSFSSGQQQENTRITVLINMAFYQGIIWRSYIKRQFVHLLFALMIMIAGLEQHFIENLSDLDSLRISWSGAEKLHIGGIAINQHRYSNFYTLHKGGHHLI